MSVGSCVAEDLPLSISQVLSKRGLTTEQAIAAFLTPTLDQLASPYAYSHMQIAVDRLLAAVRAEQPVAIYADRDVDGLSGLTVLVRTLRTLGGQVVWGSPMKGRGVEREVLERLAQSGAKVMVLVDCGTGEHAELDWLKAQGIDVIVADHHRLSPTLPEAFAWIHPEMEHAECGIRNAEEGSFNKENLIPNSAPRAPHAVSSPAGCVMAFKLAQALWLSFLGTDDPARMDYFLFSHLDVIGLGILADRMPLTGENRVLVWHGLRRLAFSRKVGLASLTRFFHLTPRTRPITVREANWQVIPILNAGGRLGRPDLTAELLITEDANTASDCIDQLLDLNTRRRTAQDESLDSFEKAVLAQCQVDSDPVLIALAQGLEPSVTGLAAQALARKYGRPAFLFVDQGDHAVGSGRGSAGVDLFAWVETHQECLVKFGGHQGAVGMTLRTVDFALFRSRLLSNAHAFNASASRRASDSVDVAHQVEASVCLSELDERWWLALSRLAPFGTGNPMPLFEITDVECITAVVKKRSKKPAEEFILKAGACEVKAAFEEGPSSPTLAKTSGESPDVWRLLPPQGEGGTSSVIGYPVAVRKTENEFTWMIREIRRSHG